MITIKMPVQQMDYINEFVFSNFTIDDCQDYIGSSTLPHHRFRLEFTYDDLLESNNPDSTRIRYLLFDYNKDKKELKIGVDSIFSFIVYYNKDISNWSFKQGSCREIYYDYLSNHDEGKLPAWDSMFHTFWAINKFILDCPSQIHREVIKHTDKVGKPGKKTKLKTTYKTVLILSLPTGVHKDVVFTCPCWEVRGHYRHLKDGRIIFIKSYKKGKLRKSVSPCDKEVEVK